jgi:hypothetical protein
MIEDMYKEEVTQQSEEGGAIVKAERSTPSILGGGGGCRVHPRRSPPGGYSARVKGLDTQARALES